MIDLHPNSVYVIGAVEFWRWVKSGGAPDRWNDWRQRRIGRQISDYLKERSRIALMNELVSSGTVATAAKTA